jgi:hypothetical protein
MPCVFPIRAARVSKRVNRSILSPWARFLTVAARIDPIAYEGIRAGEQLGRDVPSRL